MSSRPSILPFPIEGVDDAETLLMTLGFRYEIPVQGTRFRPYISAGMGVSRTEQELNIGLATVTTNAARVSATTTRTSNDDEEGFSHTGVMGSAGVGASVRVWKGLSVDLNARYYRLDRSRNLGSFGGGVSYRF